MSQAKVDRNKEQKANRKQTVARQKRQHTLTMFCGWALLVAVLGWAGYSAYGIYESNQPAVYTDLAPISDYVSSLNAAE